MIIRPATDVKRGFPAVGDSRLRFYLVNDGYGFSDWQFRPNGRKGGYLCQGTRNEVCPVALRYWKSKPAGPVVGLANLLHRLPEEIHAVGMLRSLVEGDLAAMHALSDWLDEVIGPEHHDLHLRSHFESTVSQLVFLGILPRSIRTPETRTFFETHAKRYAIDSFSDKSLNNSWNDPWRDAFAWDFDDLIDACVLHNSGAGPLDQRDQELSLFREWLAQANITELGYATWPDPILDPTANYTWAITLNVRQSTANGMVQKAHEIFAKGIPAAG